jgi:hypothetical protein
MRKDCAEGETRLHLSAMLERNSQYEVDEPLEARTDDL